MSATPLISNMSLPALERGKEKRTSLGNLKATILSVYDLPSREPPLFVSLTVGDQTVTTGPPAQRHKDRNSFKFTTNGNKSNELSIKAPLPDLYRSHATIQVQYKNKPDLTLTADYKLSNLKIHETTWLILNLEPAATEETPVDAVDEIEAPPTLRLQLTLSGPYRTEIAALVNLCQLWFSMVDSVEKSCQDIVGKLPRISLPDAKYVLVPAAPLLAFTVVSLPVIVGIMIVGLPMILPIVVVAVVAFTLIFSAGVVIYSSTKEGRSHVAGMVSPVAQTILSTPSGQTIVYQTGPRPTPVKVARVLLPKHIWGKLIVSLLIDLMGSASYLLPVVGEGFDLAWAPIQTVLIMAMYDSIAPNLKYVSFVEEIMPFTDIVPSASIGWLMEFGLPLVFGDKKRADEALSSVLNTPPRSNINR